MEAYIKFIGALQNSGFWLVQVETMIPGIPLLLGLGTRMSDAFSGPREPAGLHHPRQGERKGLDPPK